MHLCHTHPLHSGSENIPLGPYPQLQTLPPREEITDRLSLSQPQQRGKFPGPPMIVVPWPQTLEKPDWRAGALKEVKRGCPTIWHP